MDSIAQVTLDRGRRLAIGDPALAPVLHVKAHEDEQLGITTTEPLLGVTELVLADRFPSRILLFDEEPQDRVRPLGVIERGLE
jgi:hypothetical protein